MKNDMIKTSRLASSGGFGLVEVMIAAAVISIIALGIGTLIDDMMRAQKKTNTSAAIQAMRTRIIAAVQNGQAWQVSAADATRNPNMGCMRPGTANCTEATDYPLSLKDATGGEIYYGEVANHGFNYDGVTCTTYPNNACVFRWNLTWRADCQGAPTACRNPVVTVTGILEHTPGALVLPGGINLESYRFTIQRGTNAIRNDAVMVSYVMTGAAGEGPCTSTTWTTRMLNTVNADPGENIVNKSGATLSTLNQLRLRAGTYNCRVQAPAFKNGGNRLRIRALAGGTAFTVESSSANAAQNGGSATLIIESTIILNSETAFVVEQRCDSNPSLAVPFGFGSNNDQWSLGVPTRDAAGTYNNVIYTTVSCARTS